MNDDVNADLYGRDLFGDPIKPDTGQDGALAEQFRYPPFSVLNAREGWWQDRKRAWIRLGIESELGRGESLLMEAEEVTSPGLNHYRDKHKKALAYDLPDWANRGAKKVSPGGSPRPAMDYSKNQRGDGRGRPIDDNSGLTFGAFDVERYATPPTGTSIFDPVICELIYSWFCPKTGLIHDPFAGGSVRGIVAAKMGRRYRGVDLRPEQIAANEAQVENICPDNPPEWFVGDSMGIRTILPEEQGDLLFSCPPYFDLEVYSDDPADISNMKWDKFLEVYRQIIKESLATLKNNRFACFVVGDMRDKKTGSFRNFPGETTRAFQDAGAALYNEAILVTAVGSLPIRASSQFPKSRKLGKTHQNILVFIKGDFKKAVEAQDG